MIILPRQARDKHRESTQKGRPVFLGVHHVTIEGMVEKGGHATLEIREDRLEIRGVDGTTSRSLPLRQSPPPPPPSVGSRASL